MNGLFPIVRRVRRPLVALEASLKETTTGGAGAEPAEGREVPAEAGVVANGDKAKDAKRNVNPARK